MPIFQHLGSVFGARISENVRVTPDHFFVHFTDHVADGEAAFFCRDLRVKHDLEQKIAHLFGEFVVVAALERVQNFIGLFNQIGPERRVGLLAIPRAAVRSAKTRLQSHQFLEPGARGQRVSLDGFSGGCRAAFGLF